MTRSCRWTVLLNLRCSQPQVQIHLNALPFAPSLSPPSVPPESSVFNTRHHHRQRPSTPTTTTTIFQNIPSPSISLRHNTTMSPIALPTQNAVVCHGARDMRVEDRVVWPPHQNEAQVRVVATGLCGSDCEYASPACPHNVASPLWLHPYLDLISPYFASIYLYLRTR